jgi:hypothetical protein
MPSYVGLSKHSGEWSCMPHNGFVHLLGSNLSKENSGHHETQTAFKSVI